MNAFEFHGVTKAYDAFALRSIDLALPSGSIMGLVGENGAGKTTLIRLLLQILRPDSGMITLLGRESGAPMHITKQELGVVLDEVGISNCLTARQVGRMMRSIYQNWDDTVYETLLRRLSVPTDRSFEKLSRGMKMKLGICVAMSHGARLLVFDEATNGLDPLVRDDVLELLFDFTRDETHSVLLSSHIVSDLEKVCDYIAFLHRGELLLCDEKERLRERYGILQTDEQTLRALDPAAVVRCRRQPYGVNALVLRERLPHGLTANPAELEELFVYLAREEAK